MWLDLATVILAGAGLTATVVLRAGGTAIIAASALFYRLLAGSNAIGDVAVLTIICLSVAAEMLTVLLNIVARPNRAGPGGSEIMAGNLGGILVFDAIFGPPFGLLMWQLMVREAWTSIGKKAGKMAVFLCLAIAIRFIFGLIMMGVLLVNLTY